MGQSWKLLNILQCLFIFLVYISVSKEVIYASQVYLGESCLKETMHNDFVHDFVDIVFRFLSGVICCISLTLQLSTNQDHFLSSKTTDRWMHLKSCHKIIAWNAMVIKRLCRGKLLKKSQLTLRPSWPQFRHKVGKIKAVYTDTIYSPILVSTEAQFGHNRNLTIQSWIVSLTNPDQRLVACFFLFERKKELNTCSFSRTNNNN